MTIRGAQDLLRQVPLLAGLDEEPLVRLAESAEQVGLRAGEPLFHVGDPGDSMYLICRGSLEAISGDGAVIRRLGRGDRAGELALLTGRTRSASVRARRDSLLLRIARPDFESLVKDSDFALSLMQSLGAQLQSSREIEATGSSAPVVITIADRSSPISAGKLAEELASQLRAWSTVGVLDAKAIGVRATTSERARYAELLDRYEADHELVLLVVGEHDGEEWAEFCRAQADRLLVATDCSGEPPTVDIGAAQLVVCGDTPVPASDEWKRICHGQAIHRVPGRSDAVASAVARIARRLARRSLGLVLSGGGARGLAHIGALEVLASSGLQIDRIAGCSMGALVGALHACGRDADEIGKICRQELIDHNPMNDYTVPVAGLIRRRKAEQMLRRMFDDRRIEALPTSYFCVSADLVSRELVAHRMGPLYRAVGASICLPGLSPPIPEDQRLLIDGGVLNNLPVEGMATMDEGPVIAVDVTSRWRPQMNSRKTGRGRRLRGWVRQKVTGERRPLPSLSETLFQTIVLGSIDTDEAAREHAGLVIEPKVEAYGLTEFAAADAIIEAGRIAAEAALDRGSIGPSSNGLISLKTPIVAAEAC